MGVRRDTYVAVDDYSYATSMTSKNCFFMDDNVSSGREATSGAVSRISIFDHALNQSEVNYTDADDGCVDRVCATITETPEPAGLSNLFCKAAMHAGRLLHFC